MFFALIFFGGPSVVFAAVATENQELNFGEWAVTSNTASYNVHIDADGSYTHSAPLVLVGDAPTRGEYLIAGLPPATLITSIDVNQLSALDGPGSEDFSMNNFEVNYPGGTTTNGLGNLIIYLGARANTSGGGASYADGTHSGQLRLTINY
ncbi:MAG: DUF4402 domain-containing protein [Alphaproteobacteria bacterium]